MKLSKVKLIEINESYSCKAHTKINIVDGEIRYTDYEFLPMALLPDGLEPGVYSPTFKKVSLENWVEPSSWLPACIKEEYQWAAMDEDGEWNIFTEKPSSDAKEYDIMDGETHQLDLLLKTQPDPLGWENSLHTRTEDGKWVRA